MRKREEIESDAEAAGDSRTYDEEAVRLLRLLVEVQLDVRDKLDEIYMAVPEVSDIKDAIHKPGYHLK